MKRLPVVSGRTLVQVLERRGFIFVRQRGSHLMMRRIEPPHITVPIPDHKELRPGTLRGILRDIGITVEELNEILGEI
ncbi:MAG TPA: type II toxin-antitoxin system HicA family toxin [Anaerolineae bacterium]|nr:type II toxin-antitoxin system HicA family toxin [Anaerolineae bacterium]